MSKDISHRGCTRIIATSESPVRSCVPVYEVRRWNDDLIVSAESQRLNCKFSVCCFRLPTDCGTLSRAARPKLHFFSSCGSASHFILSVFFSGVSPTRRLLSFFFPTRCKSIKLRFRDYVATTSQLHRNHVATTSYLRRKSTLARVAAPQVGGKCKNEKPPWSGHHAQTLGPRPLWRGSLTTSGFLDFMFYAKLVLTYQSPPFSSVEFISSSYCCCFKYT